MAIQAKLNELRPQIDALYTRAEQAAARTDLPATLGDYGPVLDELEAIVDRSLELQHELLDVEGYIFDADMSRLHEKIYTISQLVKPRLDQLKSAANSISAKDRMLADMEARLEVLNKRERELLALDSVRVMDELQAIFKEKQLIQNELERWVD